MHFMLSREETLALMSDVSYIPAHSNETLCLYPAVLSGSDRAPGSGSGGKVIGNQLRVAYSLIHYTTNRKSIPVSFPKEHRS